MNKPDSFQKEIFLVRPGSRIKEIEMLLPIYLSAVDEMNLKNRFQLVVPTTKNMTKLVKTIIENYSSNIPIEVIDDEKEKYSYRFPLSKLLDMFFEHNHKTICSLVHTGICIDR